MATLSTNNVVATVTATTEVVLAEIEDARTEAINLFGELSDEQRESLALDAWTIGMRALGNAYAQAQEARLQDVGKALLDDIDAQLRAHVAQQQQTIASVLGGYFDPKNGQVAQRLAAFLAWGARQNQPGSAQQK